MSSWNPGDLAQCIARRWPAPRSIETPKFMQIYTVQQTSIHRTYGLGLGFDEFLTSDGKRRYWLSKYFVKVPPMKEDPDDELVVNAYLTGRNPVLV